MLKPVIFNSAGGWNFLDGVGVGDNVLFCFCVRTYNLKRKGRRGGGMERQCIEVGNSCF